MSQCDKCDYPKSVCQKCVEELRTKLDEKDKKIGFLSRQFEAEEDHANWLENERKQLRAENAALKAKLESKDKLIHALEAKLQEIRNSIARMIGG